MRGRKCLHCDRAGIGSDLKYCPDCGYSLDIGPLMGKLSKLLDESPKDDAEIKRRVEAEASIREFFEKNEGRNLLIGFLLIGVVLLSMATCLRTSNSPPSQDDPAWDRRQSDQLGGF